MWGLIELSIKRKLVLAYAKNKGADQLNSAIVVSTYYILLDSTIPLLPESYISRIVSDLVGNKESRFSHDTPQVVQNVLTFCHSNEVVTCNTIRSDFLTFNIVQKRLN